MWYRTGHAESYNPPEEFLFDKAELEAWKLMDPEDRPLEFVPQKYFVSHNYQENHLYPVKILIL
jgi:hypothetical protein